MKMTKHMEDVANGTTNRDLMYHNLEKSKQRLWDATTFARRARFKRLPKDIEEIIKTITKLQIELNKQAMRSFK